MTTTEAVAEGTIYTHATIREVTHSELVERLTRIRQRRLIAAIEFKSASQLRIAKEHAKLVEKWEKLAAKLSKVEYSIVEQIDKFEKEINQLIQISNQAKILE